MKSSSPPFRRLAWREPVLGAALLWLMFGGAPPLAAQPGETSSPSVERPWLERSCRSAPSGWTQTRPEMTGTLAQGMAALDYVSRHPAFGVEAVRIVLRELEPPAAQAFLVGLAGTLQGQQKWAEERGRDALRALTAPLEPSELDRLIGRNLVGISGLRELNGLRILDMTALPVGKRRAVRRARLSVPAPIPGQRLQKVIRLKDLDRYLSGEFQPTVGGSVAVYSQVEELHTPHELITGLRLDYPRGFYHETELAALVFSWPSEMRLKIPFDAPLGGTANPELVYPFTGTGFTATVRGRLVPELALLASERQPLPVGAELYQIDAMGRRRLRAVLGRDRLWQETTESSRSASESRARGAAR